MRVISTEKFLIKMWLEYIEDGALQQIKNIANLPFIHKWVAVMPDSHQGCGMPIGGVVALKNIISPNMVGVDIGCGMCAVNTRISTDLLTEDRIKSIIKRIKEKIPVGFSHHEKEQDTKLMPLNVPTNSVIEREYKSALKQIGTLGGGNHFIELQRDDQNNLCVMIHSRSRNLGKQVCDYYNKITINLMEKYYIPNVIKQDLAYLPVDTDEGRAYIEEMNYCIEFAFANRQLMMKRVLLSIEEEIGQFDLTDDIINIAHNYARLENHFGENVWVHRKGATSAREGEIGIIPGSMGTKSYIVIGKGNVESFKSCSHGAGRKMGRADTSRKITEKEANESMKSVIFEGWNRGIDGKLDFGEAPQAYKDIDQVIENERDLIEIMIELKPLAVVKG